MTVRSGSKPKDGHVCKAPASSTGAIYVHGLCTDANCPGSPSKNKKRKMCQGVCGVRNALFVIFVLSLAIWGTVFIKMYSHDDGYEDVNEELRYEDVNEELRTNNATSRLEEIIQIMQQINELERQKEREKDPSKMRSVELKDLSSRARDFHDMDTWENRPVNMDYMDQYHPRVTAWWKKSPEINSEVAGPSQEGGDSEKEDENNENEEKEEDDEEIGNENEGEEEENKEINEDNNEKEEEDEADENKEEDVKEDEKEEDENGNQEKNNEDNDDGNDGVELKEGDGNVHLTELEDDIDHVNVKKDKTEDKQVKQKIQALNDNKESNNAAINAERTR